MSKDNIREQYRRNQDGWRLLASEYIPQASSARVVGAEPLTAPLPLGAHRLDRPRPRRDYPAERLDASVPRRVAVPA